jgi:glycosyltransferase involved in cell wall biosynthesis
VDAKRAGVPEPVQKPLLTFLVGAFNQGRFVREAVEAAFAQTYSPLEVVLSDDCSPDGTFEVMRKAAAKYNGPHQVVLNRNPTRLSLGGHLNKAVAISRGELIVCAAGDDISLPHRCSAIYEAWENSGRKATSIHSDFVQIDENGRQIGKVFQPREEPKRGEQSLLTPTGWVRTLQPTVFGCTHAFSRTLFQTFGDVPATLIHEDDVLALRSILAGGITYIDQPLVEYRVHGENVYAAKTGRSYSLNQLAREEARIRNYFVNRQTMYAAFLEDLETAKQQGLLKEQESDDAREEAERRARHCLLVVEFLDSGVVDKCHKLIKLRDEQVDRKEYRTLRTRLLPIPLLLRARLVYNCAAAVLLGASSLVNDILTAFR